MIKALIFDLDNCLAAANEAGEQLYAPVFAAIRQASQGQIPEARLKAALNDCWYHALDWVAQKHGFSETTLAAGWQVLSQLEITQPLHGYGDLHLLPELSAERFLVTSGFQRLQQSKIKALNISTWFSGVYIDAIDQPGRLGKKAIFENILRLGRLQPAEVLVVGDNPDSELEAGNCLGIRTVQTLRPGVTRSGVATFQVHDLAGLKTLLVHLHRSTPIR
jgi:putative hydrolase of the HAD superfamily